MATTVVNIRDLPFGWWNDPKYKAICRCKPHSTGEFGNPYTMNYGRTREEVIQDFAEYAKKSITRSQVATLKGLILVCHCKPKACHGDILAAWAERYG